MSTQRNALEDIISRLKQERDELQVKMHLASMDAKDDTNGYRENAMNWPISMNRSKTQWRKPPETSFPHSGWSPAN